jgi:hypothetical protein
MTSKNGLFGSGALPSPLPSTKPAEFQFERPEWTLFRSVHTLSQKAGVSVERLRRLALKELTDNALDVGGNVWIGARDDHGDSFFIEDDGPGIDPNQVGRLLSINRPLVSSKLLRLPTRGAMGNGLRVVAGAVAASNGSLQVWTRNKHLILTPLDDGSTAVEASDARFPVGTRVDITFGPALPRDPHALSWANSAIRMAVGETYTGKPSPYWYDGDALFELLQAAGQRSVRDLIANLDGCSHAKAGKIAAAFKGRACCTLSRAEATALLNAARATARPVSPKRLGCVGQIDTLPSSTFVSETSSCSAGTNSRQSCRLLAKCGWTRMADPETGSRFTSIARPLRAP